MMFPIFLLVLSGLFEFSLLFFARGELAEATRVQSIAAGRFR